MFYSIVPDVDFCASGNKRRWASLEHIYVYSLKIHSVMFNPCVQYTPHLNGTYNI